MTMAIPPMEGIAKPKRLLADKAYDADKPRSRLKSRRIKATILSTASRTKPYPLDRAAYRRRNVVQRPFRRLDNRRRIATRYDRLATNYLAAIPLVSCVTAWT